MIIESISLLLCVWGVESWVAHNLCFCSLYQDEICSSLSGHERTLSPHRSHSKALQFAPSVPPHSLAFPSPSPLSSSLPLWGDEGERERLGWAGLGTGGGREDGELEVPCELGRPLACMLCRPGRLSGRVLLLSIKSLSLSRVLRLSWRQR